MNRPSFPPQASQPYTNGHVETPLDASGVSLHRPAPAHQPTVFPPDLPLRGLDAYFYGLHRFHLGGLPFSRYLATLWLVIALLAYLNLLPGRWITITIALLLFVAQTVIGLRYQRRNFVHFAPAPAPALHDVPLEPSEKLPIYATGVLNVEGQYRQFSGVPGFYRTFATGEHALLCRVPERKWLGLLRWPAEETGMWYAFIKPHEIEALAWGQLHFGATIYPAVAVRYRLEIPPSPRRKKATIRQELLYIATPELNDAQRIYVDLLNLLPANKVVTAPATSN